MILHQIPSWSLISWLKCPLLAGLLALTLASTNQAAADAISIAGDVGATFSALGEARISSTPTLSYTTVGPVATVGTTKRAVTVRLLEALPSGVKIVVRFSPDPGNGISTGSLTLSTVPQVLVDLIDADTGQTAKPVSYSVYASKGFSSINLGIEYVLIDK
ncbi:hypothetical protein [Deinococcus alpinitundrae]|uniref:hypothetical protein n=1 Tax=Deinococcus alpinitundrae TaxID=468913 RepID=UPI001ED92F53|nr:hypothetical protein [Deinococcus alpinitundrae]